ncbi:MAG: DnaJ domain-containing protein [Caldilinea sp.]
MSYYQTLQITPDASQMEIAAAYRRLARQVHPDLNPSPDAHRQMQVLNEAYNTLRHPDRRLRYDETLTAQRSGNAGTASTASQKRPSAAASGARAVVAWLSYQKRVGDKIVFTIGHADNMAELLAELQRRIPPAGRRYDIAHNRWHVVVVYEDVLRTLFRNYAPIIQSAPPPAAVQRTRRPAQRHSAYTYAQAGERRVWTGVGLVVAAALAVYILLFGQVILSDSVTASVDTATEQTPRRAASVSIAPADAEDASFVFPDDCTLARLGTAPSYFREACKTLESDPQLVTPSHPLALATTRVASNIRSGPDTRFPVLTTAPSGARVQLVGYTISRGYVWYLTNFGGWIRSDLLIDAPTFLPQVDADEMS